jgi:hypothetical protein
MTKYFTITNDPESTAGDGDGNVVVTGNDTTPGTLDEKIELGSNKIVKTVTNPNGNETLELDVAQENLSIQSSQIPDFDDAADLRVDLHADLTNNPHEVTKVQVGLGNVDDTSDINKPVSTAQQVELDLKTDLTTFNTHVSRHLPNGADALTTGTAVAVGTTNSEGDSNSFARANHVHDHGNQTNPDHHALATVSNNGFMSSVDKARHDTLSEIPDVTKEPTGFENRTDSVISFNNANRTFTIEPTVDEYAVFIKGNKVVIDTPLSVQIPDTYGNYYFSILPNGTLEFQTIFDISTLSDKAYISYVLWDVVNQEAILFAEERHGLTMDWATHGYLHQTVGLQLVSGANIDFDDLGDGTEASDAQIALSDMSVFDEDIRVQISNSATPSNPFEQILFPIAEIPIYYRANGEWIKQPATQYPISFGTVRANYNLNNNGVFSLEQAPSDDNYIASYIFATTNINEPVIAILSQDVYTDLDDATSRANWSSISFGDIPFQEIKLLYTVYYKTNSSYTNAVRSKIELVQDFRFGFDKGVSALSQITEHSLLTGLNSDDHLQYLNRSGVRPMTGNLSLGSNDITNVGTVNGVVVEAHSSRHLPNGADPIATASAVTVSPDTANSEGNAISFARSNHTHKVELASFNVRAVNNVSTTSPTPVLLSGMTITPAAGTYIVHANFSATLSNNSTDVTGNIFSGGTLVANTAYSLRRGGGQGDVTLTYVMSCEVTVNGSQAIEIHWQRSAGTATATGRSLTITRKS